MLRRPKHRGKPRPAGPAGAAGGATTMANTSDTIPTAADLKAVPKATEQNATTDVELAQKLTEAQETCKSQIVTENNVVDVTRNGIDGIQADDTKGGTDDTQSRANDAKSGTDDTQSGANDAKSGTNDTQSGANDAKSGTFDTQSRVDDTQSGSDDTRSGLNDTQSVVTDTQNEPAPNEGQVNGTEDVAANGPEPGGRPPVDEQPIRPARASKINRSSNFRKLIKRSKSTATQPGDADNVCLDSSPGEGTGLAGDQADIETTSSGSTDDVRALPAHEKTRSNSLRKRLSRLGHQSGSTSSLSSRESVSSEEPGAILTRQLSRKNSHAKNPINENDFTRLLLLFFSTLLGWVLKLIMFLWRQGVGFFADPPEAVEDQANDLPPVDQPGIIPLKPEITAPGKRIFFICNELTNTEEVYVDRLQILVNAKERATAIVGADIAKQMFKDIEVISLFHSNYLLPDLKDRMAHWEEHRKIGDIMRKLTPYLKLYTDYVKDFQKAEALVDYWENKSSTFAAMIRDIRDTQAARHGKLKVQAHMIEPIQRVPRYELLLRDYLKRLPEDAPDKPDAEMALVSVSQAANHFENVMKRDTRIAKLIEVRDRLDSFVNIVLPTREFISENRLNICSQRTLKPSEKTTFLFNDLFLVCSQQKMQKIMSSMKLKVKIAIDLREAELISGTNLDIPHTLWVQTKDETHTEICFSSVSDMAQWRQTLQGLIDAFTKTLLRNSTCSSMESIDGEEAVESVHEGHVQVSSDDARTWRRRWVVIGTCGRLFAFKTQQDKIPISWIRIVRFNLETANNTRKANTLVLQGFGRKYFLHFESQNDYNEWFEVLQRYQESSSPDGLEETSIEDQASSA